MNVNNNIAPTPRIAWQVLGFTRRVKPAIGKFKYANGLPGELSVSNPLSVDDTVWDDGILADTEDHWLNTLEAKVYAKNRRISTDSNEWALLSRDELIAESEDAFAQYAVLAAAVCTKDRELLESFKVNKTIFGFTDLLDKDVLNAGWTFHGYEVADKWLYSPVLNANWIRSDAEKYLGQIRLNEYGLFSTEQHARDCLQVVTRTISNHAPYFVYAIFVAHLEER